MADWAVGREEDSPTGPQYDNVFLQPTADVEGHVGSRISVEYNCYRRDIDRVVLVVYVKNGLGEWSIMGGDDNGAYPDGSLNYNKVKEVEDNSSDRGKGPVVLTASGKFPKIVVEVPDTYVDSSIYVIGGSAQIPAVPLADVLIYDPVKDSWEKGPSMNTRRLCLAAVATPDGKIYAIGGTDAGAYEKHERLNVFLPDSRKLYTGQVQNTVEVLDILH